ncbi:zinc finger CCHC domain-containing protein 7-like [Drosophila rhopaloa]|nr:zinc finger CCHC domain-containing protein 7-like [Drosophila rhopaloa]
MEASGNNELRCRNCNSKGHFAKDCRKPKRAPGSCFACGEMGHFVGQCPKRKSASDNNNYNVS